MCDDVVAKIPLPLKGIRQQRGIADVDLTKKMSSENKSSELEFDAAPVIVEETKDGRIS